MTKKTNLVSDGNLLFKGSSKEGMEYSIVPGLINLLRSQLINYCPEHKESYCLQWKIFRGPLTDENEIAEEIKEVK